MSLVNLDLKKKNHEKEEDTGKSKFPGSTRVTARVARYTPQWESATHSFLSLSHQTTMICLQRQCTLTEPTSTGKGVQVPSTGAGGNSLKS